MATSKKTRKRKQPKSQSLRSRLFVGSALPGQFWNTDIIEQGKIRFHPIGRKQPLDGDEYGRPNMRHRTFVAYLYHPDTGDGFVLGYVWQRPGAGGWSARQPNGPWRGNFSSKQAAAKALRAAFDPPPPRKQPGPVSRKPKPMKSRRKATPMTWKKED